VLKKKKKKRHSKKGGSEQLLNKGFLREKEGPDAENYLKGGRNIPQASYTTYKKEKGDLYKRQ